ATQIDPEGSWFMVPLEMQQEIWPTEDFEAALSYVPVEPIEDCLFAGLGSPAEADALARKGGLELHYDGTTKDAS
ncbi:MAG TPA: mycothiol conjugate amidase Mca, partial [Oryzihumus sp.]|nr:mycothiol conjugate amidase Mca [Oryzihumus sp.]